MSSDALITIDPASLPAHFDSNQSEQKWDAKWSESGVYNYDPERPRAETYVVDTPPPTVSGSLHIGHVFSYTQTDTLVRYRRMTGQNIYYPIGWDDNGLPTERRVQNYFHVRSDLTAPYEPALVLEPATDERRKKEHPRTVSRQNFIELCLRLTEEDEKAFKALWRRVGLSVDWREEYSTIGDLSRHIAQLSFIDLFKKGHVYSLEAPTMWDVDFQTAVAQAEVEDRKLQSFFYDIRFRVQDSDGSFVIATTRPELLPACVGVAAHPTDQRYSHLFGKRAVTPLFRVPVPIFASELVDPEKGTGILMVCTFGDATDVQWWRENKLALRQIIGRDGRLLPVTYGVPGWESLNPESANAFYGALAGKHIKAARKEIAGLLGEPSGAAVGFEAPLVGDAKEIEHSVKFYEKGDRPLEFVSSRQWFVRLLDKKDELLKLGDEIQWHPDYMRLRYRNWTEMLQFDWCISRQRHFGVAFPIWYPITSDGDADYSAPIVATDNMLPVDPMQSAPPGYDESERGQPGGFVAEFDVFDTWFTSSMSPQISSRWVLDPERHRKLFPSDLRPQAHDILRTWAFYTIAKSMLHEHTIPWKHAAISGWILDRDHKKMSKTKGNVITPMHLLDQQGSDAVRYWASNSKLGGDTLFDENVIKIGRKLVTKIFNASKFVLSQTADPGPITCALDLSFLYKLARTVERATEAFERYEYSTALAETERFFWADFTDTYLELSKLRARSEDNPAGRSSAVMTLRLGLSVLVRLFAPCLPFITEEVWSWVFATEQGIRSIHIAPWPAAADFQRVAAGSSAEIFDTAVECWNQVNKRKSESGVSIGRSIEHLRIAANPRTLERLKPVESDTMAAVRAVDYQLIEDGSLPEGAFEVRNAAFAEKA
ncbi:MAG TPA: valine--tRNA ligase [Blastocatellia bacterium]